MPKETILVVEDENDIRELIAFNLEKEGYVVKGVASGEEGMVLIADALPDLVVLDLMLPGMDGLTFCRELRSNARAKRIPVLMLTAKGEDIDIVTGLEVGADDYLCKPFSPRVLLARIKAVLRRRSAEAEGEEDVMRRGEIEIDRMRHEVRVSGETIVLTFTEFKVLELLAKRPGIVFTRYQMVDYVRGEDYPVTDRSVDVQIVGLRKKLGECSSCIETVRGVGYRFKQ